MCLAPIAYKWCSAIFEVAGHYSLLPTDFAQVPRFRAGVSQDFEYDFSHVGPSFDPVHMGEAFHHTHKYLRRPTSFLPGRFLFIILEVGFRLVTPGRGQPAFHLDHTPYYDSVFWKTYFSNDDEVVADGVCAWILDKRSMPASSCVRYLTMRANNAMPFSPRLRQMCIHLIERMWHRNLGVSELETIRLLNHLDVGVGEMEDKDGWGKLLAEVVHSPAGLNGLSIHYWHLLERFPWERRCFLEVKSRAKEVVRSLEEAGNWEKLEAWAAIVWQFDGYRYERFFSGGLERLRQATLKHLLRRPSALPRFEDISESAQPSHIMRDALRHICAQVRAERFPLEPLPP